MTTFVLVHGQGTGGWLWDDVAARLRDTAPNAGRAPKDLPGVGAGESGSGGI